jgi:hypothetical protein
MDRGSLCWSSTGIGHAGTRALRLSACGARHDILRDLLLLIVTSGSWRVRILSGWFAAVRRVTDLPFLFADIRQVEPGFFPKLRTGVRFSSPALNLSTQRPFC